MRIMHSVGRVIFALPLAQPFVSLANIKFLMSPDSDIIVGLMASHALADANNIMYAVINP
jgi:hypothetical protein